MTASIDGLITNAERRADNTLVFARSYLADAQGELLAMFANPGVVGASGVSDPTPPGAFVPAVPPTLVPTRLDTSGAPGEPEDPTPLPPVMDGIGPMPLFLEPPPDLQFPPRPAELEDFRKNAPPIDTTMDIPDTPDMDAGEMPEPTDLVMPARPGTLRSLNASAPSIRTSFSVPDAPNLIDRIGPAPVLPERSEPAAPVINVPLFAATVPEAPSAAPTNLGAQLIASYRETSPAFMAALEGQMDAQLAKMNPAYASQLALIETKLQSYIENQGTALSVATENAIFERAKDKVGAEFRRTRTEAFSDAARRGLTLPDGAAFAAVRQARLAGADASARAAVEIAVKQAELEQQNIQFALTTSASLRNAALQASISYHQGLVSLNGQAVDVAKATVNAVIESFNAAVRVYSAKMEGFKAEASVYETHIRAITVRIEIYRAQISALQALTQVDAARVDAYKASIDALLSISNIYRSQVEALGAQVGIEKLKIEAFGSEVEAYRAESQAKAAEWQGYAAAVNGEEARVGVYTAQVNGFRAKVDAKRAQMEGFKAKVDSEVARLGSEKLKIDGFVAEVQAYSAKAQAKRGAWDGYSAGVSGEATKIQAFSAQADAFGKEVMGWKSQVDAAGVRINAIGTGNKALLDSYSAQNEAYGSKMRAEGMRVSAATQFQQQLIAAYDAANRAAVAKAESESRYYQTQVQVAIERGRMDFQGLVENARVKLEAAKGISGASIESGRVLASMANAALSGMNTLVSQAE